MKNVVALVMVAGCSLYTGGDDPIDAAGPVAVDAAPVQTRPPVQYTWPFDTCSRACRAGFLTTNAWVVECEDHCLRRIYVGGAYSPCPGPELCDVGRRECELLCSTDDPALTQRCGGTVDQCVRACVTLRYDDNWHPDGCH